MAIKRGRANTSSDARKQYELNLRNKPKVGCEHDWVLDDHSNVPQCVKCNGDADIGSVYYSNAFLYARMRSERPTLIKQYGVRTDRGHIDKDKT